MKTTATAKSKTAKIKEWRELGVTKTFSQRILDTSQEAYWRAWFKRHVDTLNENGYKPMWLMYRLQENTLNPPWEMFELVGNYLSKLGVKKGVAYYAYRRRYGKEPPAKKPGRKSIPWEDLKHNPGF